ncbi:amino acid adenylation domain-containing protein [Luteolibacter ambystomatis]|uniref:Amino acid adenylation domain-containing protein n=1 Tax=Luteolibacter ambystomatis TaxID=2824561 RepID=A0A975G7A8_9BACT|nr:non-ribosomal peptide synthetase [Luteolibacter ambystomatis]QUE49615.1 amino acid adenylation domain-containing protein [Luteolibacter ambystomatis]
MNPLPADSETPSSDSMADEVLAFPASPAQEAFFYLEQLFPSHPAFNVPVRFRLDGALDLALLKRSFEALASRHETLRTSFSEQDGKLQQIVGPEQAVPMPVTDISHLSGAELDAEIDRLGSLEARAPFKLTQAPLFRASVLVIGPDRHILQITIHHAVSDGWSIGIITDELAAFYNAFLQDAEPDLEPLAVQYADFTIWQREFLEGPEVAAHLDYWKKQLDHYAELELPTDRPRPANKSWDGDIVSRILPASLSAKVAALSREQGATMFHVFLAAFKAVASRYTGQDDIAVGSPVAGRTNAELEGVIGTFINSVILRTNLAGDPSFRELLNRVRDSATDAIAHQDLPFEKLVKALQPRRDPGRNPLFQINFTHQRDFVRPVSFGGARLTAFPSRSPGAIFDLHFFMVERADGWRASCDFARDLFDRETALRLLDHFETLLEAATATPDRPLSSLPILTPPEMLQFEDWSGKRPLYPADETLGSLFLQSARRHADRTALSYDKRSISYRNLAHAALSITDKLTANGVKPGDHVALCAPSVPEMIAAQLGIVLAGASCVPLDPDYPVDRLRYMLGDCAAPALLIASSLKDRLPNGTANVIALEAIATGTTAEIPDAPIHGTTADSISHVFYTSGSTGIPKGVQVRHRGISRLVHDGGFMEFGPEDSFLQAAPISFDAATLEIWMPLLHGGRVVLAGEGGTTLTGIARAVKEEGVTCLWLTAGLFQSMIDEHAAELRGLKYLLAGGDVLSPGHVKKALETLPDTRLINGYGPTENTTFTCCHRITADDLKRPSIPIGRPVSNTTVHILDERLRPAPIGVPGELFTGGDGLAAGYLHQPELTADKFIGGPFGAPLYRTGDLCRWLPDGTIEFLGRRDHQVKIRGFRIETGEIETALAAHPDVNQAKVAARGADAGSKKLLAWITPSGTTAPDTTAIRDFLKERLPAYMVPAAIGVIGRFPLNANGKIDTKALPDPSLGNNSATNLPTTETEKRLAAIWQELLEIPAVGIDDEWFDLGGHSLLALKLFSRLHRDFDQSLPLATLISHPTIRTLAAVICPEVKKEIAPTAEVQGAALIVTLNEGSRIPLFAVHGGDGATLFYRELASLLRDRPFHAIESLQLNHSGPLEVGSIEETAAAYIEVMRRIRPQGPYCLAGYSFGGLVAWEIAHQLEKVGEGIPFVALFDTANPVAYARKNNPLERVRSFWDQHSDLPVTERAGRLAARFVEGTRTHFRVKRESAEAAIAGPAEAHTDLRRVQLREAHDEAMQRYQPPRLSGAAHLFKARFTGDKVEMAADYGWTPFCESLTIREIPGQHLTLFDPENVGEFARSLDAALQSCDPR